MKKSWLKAAILAAALLLSFTGCGQNTPISAGQTLESSLTPASESETVESTEPKGTVPSADAAADTLVKRDFGSYAMPAGWVEYGLFTTEKKIFYLVEGTEQEKSPDNISVEAGENPYSAEDHEQFRKAIVQQLLAQLKDSKAQLDGSGTYTAAGDIVYQFTITPEDGDVATTQYYIIGDHRFVLVHETAKIDSDADAAAKSIVESFVWAEDKGISSTTK